MHQYLELRIVLQSKRIKHSILETLTLQTTLSHGLNNLNEWYALKKDVKGNAIYY